MAKYYSGISSGDTLDGMIANGGEYGINPSQDIDCENIECGIITAATGIFSGNVSIGGTLTYEDVKNVDSVGIITARVGIKVSGIVTAIAGAAVTYYGDGQHLTGLTASELQVGADIRPRNVNASGITTVSTFKVGSGATIESSGNATLGILTASNATLGILTASSVICNATTIPFYPPVVTTTQRDAMTVTAGAMVFNSSTNMLNCFDGSSWKVVAFV